LLTLGFSAGYLNMSSTPTETDRLAIGFTRKFLADIDGVNSAEIFGDCYRKISHSRKRSKWLSEIHNLERAIDHVLLHSQLIGTKRSPIWVGSALGKSVHTIGDHDEKTASVIALSIAFDENYKNESIHETAIFGEHAIMRLFQRLGISKEMKYEKSKVFSEIRSATNLSSLMNLLTISADKEIKIFPKIPSASGVFLGEHHPDNRMVTSFRTFMPYDHLDDAQALNLAVISSAFEKHEQIPFYATTVLSPHYTRAMAYTAMGFICQAGPVWGTIARFFSTKTGMESNTETEEILYQMHNRIRTNAICDDLPDFVFKEKDGFLMLLNVISNFFKKYPDGNPVFSKN
jgi:hypothetical protein